jgi:sensor histidine kinase regulating citrate/malate metabolism
MQPDLSITVALQADNKSVSLRVLDSGSPVPEEARAQLFNEVIFSESGFGIGLYQSSQMAKRAGYKLLLESNNQGNVCFSLSNK